MKRSIEICLAAVLLILTTGCPGPTDPASGTNGYHILYDGNGSDSGTVPADSTLYKEGETVTAAAPGTMVRSDCRFGGWNTESDGSGTALSAGDSLTMGTADITLYASWTFETGSAGGWDPKLGDWEYFGTLDGQDISEKEIDFCRVALDKMENLIAGYSLASPESSQPKHQVKKWDGSSLSALGAGSSLPDNIRKTFDMVSDSEGTIWLSAVDNDNMGHITSCSGGEWKPAYQITAGGNTYYTALTLDDAGTLVAAWNLSNQAGPPRNQVYFKKRVSGDWSAPWDTYDVSIHDSLDITLIDGRPCAVYADSSGCAYAALHREGSGWEILGGDRISPLDATRSHVIARDSQGRPWVMFRHSGDIHIFRFDGSGWIAMDVSDLKDRVESSSAPSVMDMKLVGDIPVIAFREPDYGVRVMAWDTRTEAWVYPGGKADAAGQETDLPSLAVGEDGMIYLGFQDTSGKMSVKTYSPPMGPPPQER